MEHDFVAIGDVVIDAFIRLKDASVHCDINKERCEICMRFKDKIPYEDVFEVPTVGNSPNAAMAAARMGLKTALATDLGKDENGEKCLEVMKKEGVSTDFVSTHDGVKTNYHYVLWFEDDRTILIKHEKYPYKLPDLGNPKWIYLSSLGEDAEELYPQIEKFLSKHPETKLAFQPGTFQIKMGAQALKNIYERSEVFFCNKEEAELILGKENQQNHLRELLEGIHALGPKMVVITDGKEGSYLLQDGVAWFMPIYPDPKPPFERTGAGDAFSSTFTAALCLGYEPKDALRLAPINSMSVVQYVGAREGLLSLEMLQKYLAEAPADYAPRPLP